MKNTILVYEPSRSVQVVIETIIRRDETLRNFHLQMFAYPEVQMFKDYLREHVTEMALIVMEIADHDNFHTGAELLEFISTINGCQDVPLFILSSVPKCYLKDENIQHLVSRAHFYLEKPPHVAQLTQLIRAVV